ncbi:MAG: hypothetical protein LBT80_04820 [Lactobacillaceae bacterium]|jgi:hypothetical protein|nr:hypothetical protein [Lactobacillaceae bacterium]
MIRIIIALLALFAAASLVVVGKDIRRPGLMVLGGSIFVLTAVLWFVAI